MVFAESESERVRDSEQKTRTTYARLPDSKGES